MKKLLVTRSPTSGSVCFKDPDPPCTTRKHLRPVSSAPTPFRLPQVEWNADRKLLARPHRRLATAKLRREWMQHKYEEDRSGHNPTLGQRSKTFAVLDDKPVTERNDIRPKYDDAVSGANNVWQNDIMKRRLPERIPIVRSIRIQTAPPRAPLADKQCDSTPLFWKVSRADKTEYDKIRGRMHFINREWPSEKVSWIRLYQNVPEIHRRSWME